MKRLKELQLRIKWKIRWWLFFYEAPWSKRKRIEQNKKREILVKEHQDAIKKQEKEAIRIKKETAKIQASWSKESRQGWKELNANCNDCKNFQRLGVEGSGEGRHMIGKCGLDGKDLKIWGQDFMGMECWESRI